MSNRESVVMLDFSAQVAYWWAKARAREKYGSYIRKARIRDPESFVRPADENFEMGIFISQAATQSAEKAILWRRWFGGNAPETTIYEYVVNPEILAPEVLSRLIEVGKRKFKESVSA